MEDPCGSGGKGCHRGQNHVEIAQKSAHIGAKIVQFVPNLRESGEICAVFFVFREPAVQERVRPITPDRPQKIAHAVASVRREKCHFEVVAPLDSRRPAFDRA